jgi:hypothetical protein
MVWITSTTPWIGPINWRLHATDLGEICTPFAHYVQLDPKCCGCPAFPAFTRLPTELQIHVLRFCSSATLFQLMQTSTALRHEASKLFWSDQDAWYRVDGSWLLAGGFLGDAYYAAEFLRQVQQIEVDFEDVRNLMVSDDSRGTKQVEEPCTKQNEQLRDFWRLVQSRFPRIVRVVISESTPRKAGSSLPDNVKRITQECPSSVNGFVSAITSDAGKTNRATRYRARLSNMEGQWEVTDSPWIRQSILLPPKAWHGPVGEYAQARYQLHRYMGMKRATEPLLIEAIERSHFCGQPKPFRCPGLRCEAYFERGGEWAAHAVDTGHYMYAEAPALYKEAFARHKRIVERGFQEDVYNALERIRERCRRAGSQQQKESRQAFLAQLEHDPQYAQSKPVQESVIWLQYLERIYGEEIRSDLLE